MEKLINKKSVLEVAKVFTFTDKTQEKQYMDFLEYCIDNAPTAYDLDKVVRELEEYIPQEIEMSHERYLQYLALDKAIEIVKRGVSNEIN